MELSAEKRTIKGSKVKQLRAEGLIPAVIFSKKLSVKGEDTISLSININDFKKIYAEAGESNLVQVNVNAGNSRQVLFSEVQRDPITLEPIHVSMYEVDMTEKITANIPIVVTGEENCEPITSAEGILIVQLNEVEVKCLPADLPSNFEVDISALKEVNDVITVEQGINIDSNKIELTNAPDDIILKIDYAEQLEVEEEEPMSVDDVEVTGEKPLEEGEEGAEEETDKEKSADSEKKEEKTENKSENSEKSD